jgi:hypothetical protein
MSDKIFFHMAQELKINTQNPDAIIYQSEEIGYTILGGIPHIWRKYAAWL